jgi:hypothetical protein
MGRISFTMTSSSDQPRDCTPETLAESHQSIRDLHGYWDAKRGGRAMPARADIDPTELKRYLPDVILIDVVEDVRRYVYRLVGTHEVEMRGSDPTGKPVGEAFYAESADDTMALLDRVVQSKAPVLYHGTYQPTRTRIQEEDTLFLPLSKDGSAVNMILVYGHVQWLKDENRR